MQKRLIEKETSDENKGKISEKNILNDLTGKEWIQETNSIWYQRGLGKTHPHTAYERQHPAPFPYLMIQRLLLFFTKKGQLVLDPFSGIGSTLKACALNGRKGIGVELGEKWVKLSRKRLEAETKKGLEQKIIQGDTREVLKEFEDETFDFIVTSPPYWNILNKRADYRVKEERIKENLDTRYSDDANDLANIKDYDHFLIELGKVFSLCYKKLKTGKYMALVVSDFREKSKYVMFHADTSKVMETAGFTVKGVIILVKNAKKLYPYGYPYGFVPNIHHEYILIFRKEKADEKTDTK